MAQMDNRSSVSDLSGQTAGAQYDEQLEEDQSDAHSSQSAQVFDQSVPNENTTAILIFDVFRFTDVVVFVIEICFTTTGGGDSILKVGGVVTGSATLECLLDLLKDTICTFALSFSEVLHFLLNGAEDLFVDLNNSQI